MKTKLITLMSCFMLMVVSGYSQHSVDGAATSPLVSEADAVSAQEMPKYPGGEKAMNVYVSQHLKYPEIAREEKTQGKVTVRFMVDADGNVKSASVPKGMGVSRECDAEAVRVVMSMPAWQPGMKNGQPTATWYTLPVLFVLNTK